MEGAHARITAKKFRVFGQSQIAVELLGADSSMIGIGEKEPNECRFLHQIKALLAFSHCLFGTPAIGIVKLKADEPCEAPSLVS